MTNIENLCCDISNVQNSMCWGCYVIWYEREKEKWDKDNEEFFRDKGMSIGESLWDL